jgi:NADH:ubiquinone oxidoreductase subunit H
MFYRLAAEVVLLFHLAFMVFVISGAAAVARWPWLSVVHVPAAVWGCFVEVTGRVCPLTSAENYLRIKGGELGYTESFIEHYLLAIIYPIGLTREIQFVLAAMVVASNVAIYAWLFCRRRSSSQSDA